MALTYTCMLHPSIQQVQHNKHAIEKLGDLCQDQQNELMAQLMLVIQAKDLAPDSKYAQMYAINLPIASSECEVPLVALMYWIV